MSDEQAYAHLAELYYPDVFSFELASADRAAYLTLARPIAGAQLGPVGSAFNWAYDTYIDGLQALFGGAGSVVRDVIEAVAGLWTAIWTGIGGAIRFVYDTTVYIVTGVRNQILNVLEYVGAALAGSFDWLWDRVRDVVTYVGVGILNAIDFVTDAVAFVGVGLRNLVVGWAHNIIDWVQWAGNTVLDALAATAGFLADAVVSVVNTAIGTVLDTIDWLVTTVASGFSFVLGAVLDSIDWLWDQTSQLVIAGAQSIVGGFQAAMDFLVDRIFGPLQDSIVTKTSIPMRLLRGEYHSAEELFTDITDPIVFAAAPILLLVLVAFFILPIVTNLTSATAAPLFEPAVQRERAFVGAGLPTVGEVLEGVNRGDIDQGTAFTWLARQGLGDDPIDLLLKLRLRLPTPTDLVTMAVREVFSEDIATRFGQFEDYPSDFGRLMDLQGYGGALSGAGAAGGPGNGRTWSEAYWAAHWDLPSVTQAFEMLHRGVQLDDGSTFEFDTLNQLLRALDVMPFWRGPLTQIAYSPFTRVDARRMHAFGILDRAGVKRSYMDIGYDDQKAEALTDFTIRYNDAADRTALDDQRDLTASQIVGAYKRRVIGRNDAKQHLIDLRFHPDDAELQLAIADVELSINPFPDPSDGVQELSRGVIIQAYRSRVFSRAEAQQELEAIGFLTASADTLLAVEDWKDEQEIRELEERVVELEYKARALTDEEAVAALAALDLDPARQLLLVRRWQLQTQVKERRLSRADIEAALEAGIFTDAEAQQELESLGYTTRDAGIVLQLAAPAA
jgi:hypothetical protein